MTRILVLSFCCCLSAFFVSTSLGQSAVPPETTFDQLPGYKLYSEMRTNSRKVARTGTVSRIKWAADLKSVAFEKGGEKLQLNFNDMKIVDYEKQDEYKADAQNTRRRRRLAGRALQLTTEPSPDGKVSARFKDNSVMLEFKDDKKDESEKKDSEEKDSEEDKKESKAGAQDAMSNLVSPKGEDRLRYGTGCWVYGEELDQGDAMWWSDDSQRLAFYEIDERHMKDYFLTENNAGLYTKVKTVRYPKSGDPNPKVSIHVHDLESKRTKKLDIPGDETQYLFNIRFLPGGHELLVSRTNRHQNKLDVLAINVDDNSIRTVVSETQETWQENRPMMRMLKDGQRFIWETERNGYKHFELRNLDGELVNPISKVDDYPCGQIIKLDEEKGFVYYTAYSADIPYNTQLHRVNLDGTGHVVISASPLNHTTFAIAPDNKHVICKREQFDVPPSTAVYDENGKEVAVLNGVDWGPAKELDLSPPELFSFMASDGKTKIYGILNKPANFDPSQKYPLLISVYGGPQSSAFRNSYTPANPICEMGYLVAKIGNRGTTGRGKAFESGSYMKLGDVDIDDQAEGVKFLAGREYVDGSRVGIYGHSYGGYMSALAVLKYPKVFQVAVAGAPVTSWKNYDTIYTERYMRTPKENKSGYEEGSCMNYVKDLKGRLLLVHGLIDDNVHPSNTWQLAKQLQNENKRFDMMVYPGFKHGVGATYNSVRWEYFHKHLRPEPAKAESASH